ncbi:hypothetical protein BDZ45DRAFT_687065 [Acephala macrosclerotiorum]|nr:hypothetical protein BDZ45DRAFT_687065 [Acephala macrosclerotiorum]
MIITLAARGAQILFGVVSLILSIVLITDFGQGHNPSLINYGAFCGAGALLFAIIGVGALFFEAIAGIVILAIDGIASFFLLAGGLAFAIKVKVGDCSDVSDFGYIAKHVTLFGPSVYKYLEKDTGNTGAYERDFDADCTYRCRLIQANTALIWFLFGTFLVTLALSFTNKTTKRGGALV